MPIMPKLFQKKKPAKADRSRWRDSKVYRTQRWRRLRSYWFNRNPWCEDPFGVHRQYKVRATDLDHITPLRDVEDPYEDSNLQGLCKRCHSKKTRQELLNR